MRRLKLLQIGDIHYPSSKSSSIKVDLKDPSFPQAIIQLSATDVMRNAFRQILTLTNDKNRGIDGVLLCGDLTSYGNIEGYRDCLKYLDKTLKINNRNRWPINTIHVVPGNHDVNRTGRDPEGIDLDRKFVSLTTEWASYGLEVFAPNAYRATNITSGDNVTARVFSLNSCIGCGERRFLPEKIQKELAELIENRLALDEDEKNFPLPQEDLDTPAFREEDITGVCEEINTMSRTAIPVILGHHNLLPQAIPRISIYTELVNGGLARSRLAELGRPVIYCHGHIHDDPVEIVTSPQTNSLGLVSISAPEIIKGFNVIEIQFGREKTPLGCIIWPYRVHRDGSVKPLSPTRVRLQWKNEDKLAGDTEKKIFRSLVELPAFAFHRFDEIYEKIQQTAKQLLGRTIHRTTLSDALLEAEWLGLVEIDHREEEARYWQAQRIVP